MPNIGPMELIVVLVIVLLVFGPKRLPGLGKQLGSGMREFKESISGSSKDDDVDATGLPALPEADRTKAPAPVVAPADRVASDRVAAPTEPPAREPSA